MKKVLVIAFLILLTFICIGQTKIITTNKLIIHHGDITLYLNDDTTTMVSEHILSYKNFEKLGTYPRDNKWFQDTYKGKYKKSAYAHSGYDLGHLTPSSITSYDSLENHCSFSMFNEAPQLSYFNEHPWEQLEMHVQDTIAKYKKDAIIITGVIYDEYHITYLKNSKIPIPIYYFKILDVDNMIYYWIGSNVDGKISETSLDDLNMYFTKYNMHLIISL